MLNVENSKMNSEDASILSLYMKELNRLPLLTREEEIELCNRVKTVTRELVPK